MLNKSKSKSWVEQRQMKANIASCRLLDDDTSTGLGNRKRRIQGKVHDLIQYGRVMKSKIYWLSSNRQLKVEVSVREILSAYTS